MDTGTGMTGGTDTGMTGETGTEMPEEPAPTIGEGLAGSTATPVTSGSADDTLATLLPDSTNQFAPLTTSVERDFGASTETTSEAHVKTIATDGDPTFQIAPENWPWNPGHPDHERFVAEFWETAFLSAPGAIGYFRILAMMSWTASWSYR